jgi:Beta-lactamase
VISTTADLGRFFRALLGGGLLRPDLLTQMQTTVAATEFQDEFTPGYRYGLGLVWNPLPCGGGYWHHGGDTPATTAVKASPPTATAAWWSPTPPSRPTRSPQPGRPSPPSG